MIVKYEVEGTIEVDLNDEEIEELESNKSETMKKAYLEQLLIDKLYTCSLTARHEFVLKNFTFYVIGNDLLVI